MSTLTLSPELAEACAEAADGDVISINVTGKLTKTPDGAATVEISAADPCVPAEEEAEKETYQAMPAEEEAEEEAVPAMPAGKRKGPPMAPAIAVMIGGGKMPRK